MELDRPRMRMKEIMDRLAVMVRQCGFKGSGQNFRKVLGDFVFVINFQKSKWGHEFFINLAAQPLFIPAENGSQPDLKKIKEYECIFRTRVGTSYHWAMGKDKTEELAVALSNAQNDFSTSVLSFQLALAADTPESLISNFRPIMITTDALATLHFARACIALGFPEKAKQLVHLGLKLAGEQATALRAQLNALTQINP